MASDRSSGSNHRSGRRRYRIVTSTIGLLPPDLAGYPLSNAHVMAFWWALCGITLNALAPVEEVRPERRPLGHGNGSAADSSIPRGELP